MSPYTPETLHRLVPFNMSNKIFSPWETWGLCPLQEPPPVTLYLDPAPAGEAHIDKPKVCFA